MQKTLRKKKNPLTTVLVINLSFFSLILVCSSCYEPIEGCLDFQSANYNVSADRACDSCCVYPNLSLNINQVFNKEDFSLGDTLINIQGNQLVLSDYSIIMSAFRTIKDNIEFAIADSFELSCLTSSIVPSYSRDDLIVITKSAGLKIPGPIRPSGDFNGLKFLIGLNECFHNASLEDLGHVAIINQIDTLYNDDVGFTNLFFEFNDSLRISFDGVSDVINFDLVGDFSNDTGKALAVNMNIDFGIWFSDLNLQEDSSPDLKAKLKANASKAITLGQ